MLGEYIKSATARQFGWADHDCSTFAADWRVACGHGDPMADIRGLYHDELSGRELIKSGGGLLSLWEERMPECSKNPIAGAVGVIDLFGQIMGIYSGERWIFLMESGIRSIHIPNNRILKAWNG